jgi:hypothetical protein
VGKYHHQWDQTGRQTGREGGQGGQVGVRSSVLETPHPSLPSTARSSHGTLNSLSLSLSLLFFFLKKKEKKNVKNKRAYYIYVLTLRHRGDWAFP